MTKKETPDYEAELIREYEHWEYMKEYGGKIPVWEGMSKEEAEESPFSRQGH